MIIVDPIMGNRLCFVRIDLGLNGDTVVHIDTVCTRLVL